jgi:AraC-like DNA-binding protein
MNGALENENILGLAFESGFPSKSTFNRVFKESYGVAPSLYAAGLGKVKVLSHPAD